MAELKNTYCAVKHSMGLFSFGVQISKRSIVKRTRRFRQTEISSILLLATDKAITTKIDPYCCQNTIRYVF